SVAHVMSVLRVTTRCTGSPFLTSIFSGSNPLLVTASSMVRADGAAASRMAKRMAFMRRVSLELRKAPDPRTGFRVHDAIMAQVRHRLQCRHCRRSAPQGREAP